jgi:DNA-binding SARP family transcriptional activator/tetratricopeptide (TPR) repeat protein
VEVRLLGPVEVWAAGRKQELGPPQLRAVLAAVAVDAGRPVLPETLIDRVWGEEPPSRVRAAIHVHVTRIRRVLGRASESEDGRQAPVVLARQAGGYVLETELDQVDLHRFQQLRGQARDRGCPEPERAALLRAALDLWHGPGLADLAGGWPTRVRESWAQERLDAVVDWAETEVRLGRHHEVIGPIRTLVADYPLTEPLTAVLMQALVAVGRSAEAVDCYAATRARLADELGVEPGPELRGLHEAVLRGGPVGGVGPGPSGPVARPVLRPGVVPAQLPADAYGFAGRRDQLARLDAILDRSAEQPTTAEICALSGTAGVGKTALAVHWAHRIADRFPDGQLYVNLRGCDPGGQVLDPAEALRGFLDALDVPADRTPSTLDAQAALYRSLLAGRRVLVVVDNARDADQVRPLLPGTPSALTIVTSRSPLTSLAAVEGAHSLTVDLPGPAEARELLAGRLGAERVAAEPAAVDDIVTWCARLPLALAIIAARAAARPAFPLARLAAEVASARSRLDVLAGDDAATDLRTAFAWSYRQLSPEAARLFRLIRLHPGPDVSAAAAASLAGRPPARVRRLLAELAAAHLVSEHLPARYSCHDLLRTYAADLLRDRHPADRRGTATARVLDHYLHTAHAAALLLDPCRTPLTLAPVQPGVTPEDLADHAAALTWFTDEQAVLLTGIRNAADAGLDAYVCRLAWSVTNFLDRQGHWPDMARINRAALDAARRLCDRAEQADARLRLARAYTRLGWHREADSHFRAARELFAELDDRAGQARAHYHLAYLEGRQGRPAAAVGHARRALDLSQLTGSRYQQALARHALGWYQAELGDHRQALSSCQHALTMLLRTGDRHGQAAAWRSLGYAHHRLGGHDRAGACYQQAVELFAPLGDRYEVATTLANLGDAQAAAGAAAAARDAWQHALAILDELGHRDADRIRARWDHPDRHAGTAT